MDDDQTTSEKPNLDAATQAQILDYQRRIAQSVANVAIQVTTMAEVIQRESEMLRGLSLAILAERRLGERVRKDSGDVTDQFHLPAGVGSVAITRRAQRRMIGAVIFAIGTGILHIVAHLLHR